MATINSEPAALFELDSFNEYAKNFEAFGDDLSDIDANAYQTLVKLVPLLIQLSVQRTKSFDEATSATEESKSSDYNTTESFIKFFAENDLIA